jgi:transposase
MWTLHQPDSALTRWWRQRFAGGGKRLRCIGIVALARKLMIALWRYVKQDLVPEGAGARLAPPSRSDADVIRRRGVHGMGCAV